MFDIIKDTFFSPILSFKSRIYNLVALSGIIVCFLVFIISLINGTTVLNSIALLATAVIVMFLLYYSSSTGNYNKSYFITVILVFLIIFPILFFAAGGYKSGMPPFFVLAVTFTLFILEGRIGLLFSVFETVLYIICIFIAYKYPDIVTPFADEASLVTDIVTGTAASSLALGTTMYFQIKMFNTQQKKAEIAMEEANKSNKAKGIFLANMSHEIRTPINVILGMNELINRSWDPEEIHEHSNLIQNSGTHLLSLINNILDFTQIESGKLTTSVKPYRTDSLFSELISIGTELCNKKGLEFKTNIYPNTISMLEGDKNHLRQILVNFLSNAVKYTDKGSVTLFAETRVQREDIALLRITITDTGIGIREKDLEHIFEIFKRGKNALESAVEGTGLGLAIAKTLADTLGGKLIVKSKENEGSTFGIEILQKICDSHTIGKFTPNAGEKSSSDSFIAPECRVLAVDDNKDNLRVIEMLLERTMITVDTALDGYSALEKVSQNNYDLIFLDYMMPDLDGIETFKKMRFNGLNESIPVVALTAEALSGSEDKFLSEGFTAYLSKPVSWHDLEKTLINLLPANKVTINSISEGNVSGEEIDAMAKKLSKYDIDLESGLSFLSGNITRFKALAKIYVEGFEHNFESVKKMFEETDNNLVYEVHSLKSASKGIGAMNLYEQAAEIEKRLKNGDTDYASNAKDLLLFEWERVTNGMKLLINEISDQKPVESSSQANSSNLEAQIEKGLEDHVWLETLNAINQLIELETDEERKKKLQYIADFVDELDFVSAQTLYSQIKK